MIETIDCSFLKSYILNLVILIAAEYTRKINYEYSEEEEGVAAYILFSLFIFTIISCFIMEIFAIEKMSFKLLYILLYAIAIVNFIFAIMCFVIRIFFKKSSLLIFENHIILYLFSFSLSIIRIADVFFIM